MEPWRRIAAAEVMPLDDARESAALADADHVHFVVGLELVGQNAVARLQVAFAALLGAGTRAGTSTPSAPDFFR